MEQKSFTNRSLLETFFEGFQKRANALSHAVELGGLGLLARPSIAKARGKPMSQKSEAHNEMAGLGVLAAPSAVSLGKSLLKRV